MHRPYSHCSSFLVAAPVAVQMNMIFRPNPFITVPQKSASLLASHERHCLFPSVPVKNRFCSIGTWTPQREASDQGEWSKKIASVLGGGLGKHAQ